MSIIHVAFFRICVAHYEKCSRIAHACTTRCFYYNIIRNGGPKALGWKLPVCCSFLPMLLIYIHLLAWLGTRCEGTVFYGYRTLRPIPPEGLPAGIDVNDID